MHIAHTGDAHRGDAHCTHAHIAHLIVDAHTGDAHRTHAHAHLLQRKPLIFSRSQNFRGYRHKCQHRIVHVTHLKKGVYQMKIEELSRKISAKPCQGFKQQNCAQWWLDDSDARMLHWKWHNKVYYNPDIRSFCPLTSIWARTIEPKIRWYQELKWCPLLLAVK